MKILFIGGTGIISSACARLAIERGLELTLLTRGQHSSELPSSARRIIGDIRADSVAALFAAEDFDVVVQWVGFVPEDIEHDLKLFEGRIKQYLYISSASAYEKPPRQYVIHEQTPLSNPFWEYSRNKIACEERLMLAYRESGFPVTIVRPSLTYGDTQIPLAVNSWQLPYTVVERMRKGKEIIVPGDGTSLWVITHNSDFAKGLVGLLGQERAVGQAFHITSDEVQSWDQYFLQTAEAAGVEARLIHIPSDFIAAFRPEMHGSLVGDKAVSVVFDNSKIRRFVPDYVATMPFREGIRRTIAWFDADPARRRVDEELDSACDEMIGAYKAGLSRARHLARF